MLEKNSPKGHALRTLTTEYFVHHNFILFSELRLDQMVIHHNTTENRENTEEHNIATLK